jgi:uncharacterized RDD family membrane protein YckC
VSTQRLPLLPRLVSMVYEALIAGGILMAAGLPFVMLTRYGQHPEFRTAYQIYLFLVLGFYFSYFWHRSGQTVPMKTWRYRLVDLQGQLPSWPRAVLRYLLAWLCLPSGASILWALLDREGQFLHDRLTGLHLIREART